MAGQSEIIERPEFPGVRIQRLDRNYGFAGGYNRAVADSQAELVVHLKREFDRWGPVVKASGFSADGQ